MSATTNGKQHETNGTAAASKPLPLAVRVFRVEPGTTVICRVLSETYGGLFTHYARGRSQLCLRADCQMRNCDVDRVWKGYAAVQLYNAASKKWMPAALEITERLELDLRGFFCRGQVWEFYREHQTDKKKTPVTGKLLEERDPKGLPAAFDLIPILRSLYHTDRVKLDQDNPLPMRVYADESEGDMPAIVKEIEDRKKAPMPEGSFLDAFKNRAKTPTEKKAAAT